MYTGSGKKQPADAGPAQIACKKYACNIQWCMAKHNHQQDKCVEYVDAWKDCCDRVNAFESAKAKASQTSDGEGK